MGNTRYLVLLSLFVSMAGALHVIEGLLPVPLPVPGAKIGLSNIVSLFLLVNMDFKSSFYVTAARVTLGSLFGGAFLGPSFVMSMGAGVTSLWAMNFCWQKMTPPFSVYGVSVLGSVVHNMTQVILAAALVSSLSLLWYIPYLIFFAVPAGVFTGAAVIYLTERLPRDLMRGAP